MWILYIFVALLYFVALGIIGQSFTYLQNYVNIYVDSIYFAIASTNILLILADYIQHDKDMNIFSEFSKLDIKNANNIVELCGFIFVTEFIFNTSKKSKSYVANFLKCCVIVICIILPFCKLEIIENHSSEMIIFCFILTMWNIGMKEFYKRSKRKAYVKLITKFQNLQSENDLEQ